MTASDTVRARCRRCNHRWVIAHLPMGLGQVASLMMVARCPKCASSEAYLDYEEEPAP